MFTALRLMEALESRTLFSAAPSPLSTAVLADRLQIRADLLQFKSDVVSCWATMLHDVNAVKADHPAAATTVLPLIKQFRIDLAHKRSTLLSDRLAERSNVLADESLIVRELRQILLDHGNPTAVAADRQVLLTDRIKLQNDEIAGLDQRIADRQAAYTTIFNDVQAIITAVNSDPNASAQLKADVTKWGNDRTTCMTTLTADLQRVAADRQQLVTDLTALQSA